MKSKIIILAKIILLSILIAANGNAQSASDISQHISVLSEKYGSLGFPCFMHPGMKYSDRFPAKTVLAELPINNTISDGKVTSRLYQLASFKPVDRLTSGTKVIYFRPYTWFNFEEGPEEEYVGHLRIDAEVVHEPFDEKVHGNWPFDTGLLSTNTPDVRSGNDLVKPIRYALETWEQYDTSGYPLPAKPREWIAYEMCRFRWPMPAYLPEELPYLKQQYPDFPFEDSNGWLYKEDQVPTFRGYEYTRRNQQDPALLPSLPVLFLTTGQFLPIVGTAIAIDECWDSGDPLCWASAATSFAGDVIAIGRLGKAYNLVSKFSDAASKGADAGRICRALKRAAENDVDLFLLNASNITIGALYLKREEYLRGAGQMLEGGVEVATALLATKFGYKLGIIGKYIKDAPQRQRIKERLLDVKYRPSWMDNSTYVKNLDRELKRITSWKEAEISDPRFCNYFKENDRDFFAAMGHDMVQSDKMKMFLMSAHGNIPDSCLEAFRDTLDAGKDRFLLGANDTPIFYATCSGTTEESILTILRAPQITGRPAVGLRNPNHILYQGPNNDEGQVIVVADLKGNIVDPDIAFGLVRPGSDVVEPWSPSASGLVDPKRFPKLQDINPEFREYVSQNAAELGNSLRRQCLIND